MDILFAIFNASLYLMFLLVYWHNHKRLDLYFIILTAYTIVAILGCVLLCTNTMKYDLSMFNFIYLFTCVLIFLQPFKYAKFSATNIFILDNGFIKILLTIYLIAGIISLYYSIPRILALSAEADWNQIRQNVYSGEEIEYYGNSFEKLTKNIFSYLSPFGVVMTFYQLTKNKINVLLTLSLFFVWLSSTYCSSAVVASRGMMVKLVGMAMIMFIIFKDSIPKNRKKVLLIMSIGVIAFFGSYILVVSQSRFGNDAGGSVFEYLGHSMLSFNDGIMNSMHDYGYGKYFFKWFYPIFGINSDLNLATLGCTHGSAFMTFVGCFYIDFGPIGTIILGLLVSELLYRFTKQKCYYLSDITIVAYFANWYLNGVFVVGRSASLGWLMAFVVYFIVRTVETKKTIKPSKIDTLLQ